MDADQLQANVLHVIQQANLFLPNETLIIALSGGGDSLALLLLLQDFQPQLQIKLHAAILNHGIRLEAREEVAYVKTITARLGVELDAGFKDVPQFAQTKGLNLELAARIARYEFLAEVAQKYGAKKVVTGHHADDQAETILLHLIRGTGLKGLAGMQIVSPVPYVEAELQVVRPLLDVTHQQLVEYCIYHQVQPVEDQSNQDANFRRNYLRQWVMPLLKELNPNLTSTLKRTAEIVREDVSYFDQVVSGYLQVHDDHVLVERRAFHAAARAVQRRIVHEAVFRLDGELSHERILEGVQIGSSGAVGKVVEFAEGVRLRVDYKMLVFERVDRPIDDGMQLYLLELDTDIPLSLPGTTSIPEQGWSVTIQASNDELSAPDMLALAPDKELRLRTRRPGDRIRLKGMDDKSKKIKDWMIDYKVPRAIRDSIPLLTVDDAVVAIIYEGRLIVAESVGIRTEAELFWQIFVNFS